MRKILVVVIIIFACCESYGQATINTDPEIAQMIKEVSADSLRAYINTLVAFGTRHTMSTQTDTKRGIGAARNWVLSRFNEFAKQSGGRMTAMIDTFTIKAEGKYVDADVHAANVIAVLKGTNPNDNRIFIISGHIDSRRSDVMDRTGDSPGANDDGSGCAAVIECARIMSKHAFGATIIFVTVSGEEQNLLGADYMAKKAKKENWNIETVLNNDIMGGNNSNETNNISNAQVRVFSEGLPLYELDSAAKKIRQLGIENDGKARQLARYVKETGERYVDNLQVMMIYRNDRFLRAGDHTPYVENGFAAVRITEMNENYYHQHQDVRIENGIQYGDLPQFMDFEYLRKNTALNLCNLANLAKAPAMPKDVKIDIKNLSNYTHLFWQQPASGAAKGFYVLMRETTSAFWQKKIYTESTDITLPYSKDNYFFAVQSVNENGNESLAAVPTVSR